MLRVVDDGSDEVIDKVDGQNGCEVVMVFLEQYVESSQYEEVHSVAMLRLGHS